MLTPWVQELLQVSWYLFTEIFTCSYWSFQTKSTTTNDNQKCVFKFTYFCCKFGSCDLLLLHFHRKLRLYSKLFQHHYVHTQLFFCSCYPKALILIFSLNLGLYFYCLHYQTILSCHTRTLPHNKALQWWTHQLSILLIHTYWSYIS